MMKRLPVFILFVCQFHLFAQQSPVSWSISNEANQRFIKNDGQFDGRNRLPDSKILYGVDNGALQIFFTKEGVTYYVEKKEKNSQRKKGDRTKPKLVKSYELIHFMWEGANPNVEVQGEEKTSDYFCYSFLTKDKSSTYSFDSISGYKKLVYKNLYPHIDVEYVFHPEIGVKYSVILHPGADISKMKMKYAEGSDPCLNGAGNIIIPTMLGAIIEHAPVTFYARNGESIPSEFIQHNSTISFKLGNYNQSKTVVIDPWVQTPVLANSNAMWECEKDASGNVYVIGGDAPMRLQKYSSTGALQWTYSTPWDTTAGDWLGTLATDQAGNSYVTNGSNAAIQKVNSAGTLLWDELGTVIPATEYWSVQFNCDQTKLVIGGTTLGLPSHGTIFNLSTTNGAILGIAHVTGNRPGFIIPDINEVRAITSSRNAKYYFLTLDTIGAINQNIGGCSTAPVFKTNSTYNFGYKCENYRPSNGNSGICAIRANDQFVYSQNGTTLHKRSLTTGLPIASVSLPGGLSTTTLGFSQPGNSGIDIDDCGNVYVGSGDRVLKYDANLGLITSVATPFRVYDVTVSYNGEIIVTGATGNNSSSSRTGYVQSINMSACAPFLLTCCDATICEAGPFCSNEPPVTLTRTTPGGTWSGTGITNPTTGTFSPSVAGPGTHTITYTLPCGSDTRNITVYNCPPLEVCVEPNGQLTASGGAGAPYTWERGTPFQNCNACPLPGICLPPFCSGFPDTNWTFISTGATVTPGTLPIRVRDRGILDLMITSTAGLPTCSTVVCPTITVSVSAQTNVSCPGLSNGSATVSAAGGTAPYSYNWMPGMFTGPTATTLIVGTYSITATDANGCTGTGSVTITAPTALALTPAKTDATCTESNGVASVSGSGGTPPYSYLWSNTETTPSIDSLAVGSYTVTVTDANTCSATATVSITSIGGPSVSISSQTNVLCNGDNNGAINITVNGGSTPYGFLWSNGATTQNISNLSGGNFSVTVTDNAGCPAALNVTLTEPAALAVTGVVTDAGCSVPVGAIDITATGGTTPYLYNWSSGSALADLNGLQSGSYTVTVTDNNQCTTTGSYTVNAPGNFTVALTADSASCNGATDGSITTSITGGAAPFFYNWSNGAISQNLSNVAPGIYTVTITDDNICSVTATDTVLAPTVMRFSASITGVLCENENIGGIKLAVFGGTPPYSALWSSGHSGLTLTDLAAGTYTATVIDANGCNNDTTIELIAASVFTLETSVTDASCNGAENGSVTVNIVNATTPPFTYSWNTGDSVATLTNVAPGTYMVTVVDSFNCPKNTAATIGVSGGLSIDFAVIDVSCPGREDGSVVAAVAGGTTPYSYLWNTGATVNSLTNVGADVYALTVTDDNECIGMDTVLVGVDSTNAGQCDTLVIYEIFSPNGDGTNDTWIIDGLESYPANDLQIFNRWGSVVFEAKPYLNNWTGLSNKDEALPPAAYYYILKLNDADESVHSGTITIVR